MPSFDISQQVCVVGIGKITQQHFINDIKRYGATQGLQYQRKMTDWDYGLLIYVSEWHATEAINIVCYIIICVYNYTQRNFKFVYVVSLYIQ